MQDNIVEVLKPLQILKWKNTGQVFWMPCCKSGTCSAPGPSTIHQLFRKCMHLYHCDGALRQWEEMTSHLTHAGNNGLLKTFQDLPPAMSCPLCAPLRPNGLWSSEGREGIWLSLTSSCLFPPLHVFSPIFSPKQQKYWYIFILNLMHLNEKIQAQCDKKRHWSKG